MLSLPGPVFCSEAATDSGWVRRAGSPLLCPHGVRLHGRKAQAGRVRILQEQRRAKADSKYRGWRELGGKTVHLHGEMRVAG